MEWLDYTPPNLRGPTGEPCRSQQGETIQLHKGSPRSSGTCQIYRIGYIARFLPHVANLSQEASVEIRAPKNQ